MRAGKFVNKVTMALMTNPCKIASPSTSLLFSPSHTANARQTPPPPRSFVAASDASENANQLDAIFRKKHALRSKIRRELKNMSLIQRSEEDNSIQNIVLEAPWFKSSQSLCTYISSAALREVDTSTILAEVLHHVPSNKQEKPKRVYVPRVEDRFSNMRMLNISSLDDLVKSSMDILEPAPVDSDGKEREDVMQASEPVDLFIVPGLAFDRSGRRLGRSGGYYDLFLRNYEELVKRKNWKQPLLVALAYSIQVVEEGAIPITPNDVPVDALVSPAGFIPISPIAKKLHDSTVAF
ncbi:PREDICTED: 5-formyltetrahydrofolate cyclo-ligase, mitochondrial-like [Ipomoea nil]|uniref:5-formyltetrahydrofolate cyclo-ligase, mitochondrial-like n=1 Tax=Ipomoea nil TaxID=35883 RepID=UPI0009009860|nr:PREDICTED: 5-formyltetrahydrofolate cyclo-ligase, mitochondrial-like [Ipomoea nil]